MTRALGSSSVRIAEEVNLHRYPGVHSFFELSKEGKCECSFTQWGLVRTVVSSDGLPEKDRTSLAPLTPQAPESPQQSESGGYIADTSSVIPCMESSQHIGELKMGISMR